MELYEVLEKRRTYRDFSDREVSDEILKKVLLLSLLGLFLALLIALLVLKFSKKERTKKAYIIVKRICTTVFMLFLLLLALKAYWIINPPTCACGTSGFTLESGDKSAYF